MTSRTTQPFGAHLRDDVIKIEVGPYGNQYTVHPGLLVQHSEYFKRTLNGPWKESRERVIKLDDVKCDTFELFLEWLYTQQYPKDDRFSEEYEEIHEGAVLHNHLRRLEMCVLGDRLQAAEFLKLSESALVDHIIGTDSPPYYKAVIYAFNHLPSSNPVLQLLIDKHCFSWSESSDDLVAEELELRNHLPHSFLLGIALRYGRMRDVVDEQSPDPCDYHRHKQGDRRGNQCEVPRVGSFHRARYFRTGMHARRHGQKWCQYRPLLNFSDSGV